AGDRQRGRLALRGGHLLRRLSRVEALRGPVRGVRLFVELLDGAAAGGPRAARSALRQGAEAGEEVGAGVYAREMRVKSSLFLAFALALAACNAPEPFRMPGDTTTSTSSTSSMPDDAIDTGAWLDTDCDP